MSDAPQTAPQTKTPFDPRLVEFSYAADCDINAMKAAVELVQRDPTIISVLDNVRRGDPNALRIDFNKDGNINPNGVVAASNREWASAVIAVAQLWREKGIPPEKLEVQDIIDRGQCIYDQFKNKETGKTAAVCTTGKTR